MKWGQDMNIEQLQYICMVAKTNSITVAAENLYVTQQTISKAINKLENELGVVLMIRSHKGVQLTDVGKVFVEKASRIVREFQELYDTTYVNSSSNLTGQVRLFLSNYTGHLVGSRFWSDMRRQYPKLHVIVEELLNREIIERLQKGEEEIGLIQAVNRNCGFGRIEDFENELDWELVLRDTLVACVSPNSPLAKKESVSLKELGKYPVAWGECYHMKDILQQDYQIDIQVMINSSNMMLQRSAIFDGAAVSFATEMIVHDSGYDTSDLKIVPIKENLRLETFLVKPKGYELNKLQTVVIEELKRTLQKI